MSSSKITRNTSVIALIALTFSLACANAKQTALRGALTTVNAARNGFVVWDDQHQQKIVADATSREQGQKALDNYRADREKIVRSFEVVYKAIAVAALDMTAASISTAVVLAVDIGKAVKALMSSSPSEPAPPVTGDPSSPNPNR